MWAREDERFQSKPPILKSLMELDEKQFDLGKEQRQTMYDFERKELAA